MKSLFALAILLLCAVSVSAQTASETAEWLNTKLTTLARTQDDGRRRLPKITKYQASGETPGVVGSDYIRFSDVKGVSSRRTSRAVIVVLVGPSHCPACSEIQENSEWSFPLDGETPPAEVDRVLKAFRHMAQLCGAKLIDDDLFK